MSLTRPLTRPLVRGLARRIASHGFGGADPDALAWAAAVTANSGTYSAATLAAVSTFCKAAKTSGYWTKLNRINLFCGDQLAAALVPLKVGGGGSTDTNVNFVSGDYTEATGLTGNATTKYLNTGLVPSASLALNDTHLSVYNRSSTLPVGAAVIHIGALGVGRINLDAPYSDGNAYSEQYGTGAGRVSAALATPYGFVIGSRTASTSHAVYRNGVSLAANATSEGASLSANSVFVFAANNGGTPNGYTVGPLAAYSIGSGLTAGDVTAYNTHMEAFQDALGRGVQ